MGVLSLGKVVKGKITKITNFGAFVAVEDGKSGMIHISEVSSAFVKDIRDYLKEGEEVSAVVISEDENGRLALSLKRALPQKKSASAFPPADFYTERKTEDKNFESMMSRFKTVSDEKIGDLKKGYDSKRGKGTKKPKK
ncbi:MAG: S1 RNA-binding domain-containing protein [Eubacteriales bacterium]